MGWRYRKSIKIGPFRINFSNKGIGWSVGNSFARTTFTADGHIRETRTIPGTGITKVTTRKAPPKQPHSTAFYAMKLALQGIVVGILLLFTGVAIFGGSPGWIIAVWLIPLLLMIRPLMKSVKQLKK